MHSLNYLGNSHRKMDVESLFFAALRRCKSNGVSELAAGKSRRALTATASAAAFYRRAQGGSRAVDKTDAVGFALGACTSEVPIYTNRSGKSPCGLSSGRDGHQMATSCHLGQNTSCIGSTGASPSTREKFKAKDAARVFRPVAFQFFWPYTTRFWVTLHFRSNQLRDALGT